MAVALTNYPVNAENKADKRAVAQQPSVAKEDAKAEVKKPSKKAK